MKEGLRPSCKLLWMMRRGGKGEEVLTLFSGSPASRHLDATGLYYYNARYYDPQIGRFISPDTIIPHPSNPQCFNRYSYCLNNPLKYIDPSGNIVNIGGTNVQDLRNAVNSGNYMWFLQQQNQNPIGILSQTPLLIAYGTLSCVAPELTGYLEASPSVVSIEWNSVLSPLAGAQFHAGYGEKGWIYVNESQKGGDINVLAASLGHEGFHGAVWMVLGQRENFAANEAFAYSFDYSIAKKLGVNPYALSAAMSDINPWFSGDLNSRLTEAAITLFDADSYNYGRQNFWDVLVSFFHYQRRPMREWASNDRQGSSFLTVAKAVWMN